MVVGEIMTKEVMTVSMDHTLGQIKALFLEHKFHHVLVLDEGKLMGVISDRDVLKQISPYVGTIAEENRDLNTVKKRAHQIMSRKIISIPPDADIEDAAQMLLKEDISCLPVLSESSDIEGIITRHDLLHYYVFQKDQVEV
jgi:acetoin utilization protein AcuB